MTLFNKKSPSVSRRALIRLTRINPPEADKYQATVKSKLLSEIEGIFSSLVFLPSSLASPDNQSICSKTVKLRGQKGRFSSKRRVS